MNNISIIEDKCCGCGLCSKICPFHAIEMKENNEGFLYPFINKKKCKNCGLCLKKCVSCNKDTNNSQKVKNCLMVISKDKVIYNNSASGGFATVLSKYIIEKENGVVYGCNLGVDHLVKHIRIDNTNDLHKLQDSKYVQSNIISTFDSIKKDVSDKRVLFIGTPCQVSAIKRHIPKQHLKNLVTCDLVCHGVPSPGFFKKHLEHLQKKYNKNIEYRFRNKSSYDKCGFRGKIKYGNKEKYFYIENDRFYNDFILEKNYRKSCYQCIYKTLDRVGDFTVGDVNSWELYYDFYPELAPSLVIINSETAMKLFDNIKYKVHYKNISIDEEVKLNNALSKQTNYPSDRDYIYNSYFNNEARVNKLDIKRIAKTIIPFKLRLAIKKMRKKNEK